MSDILKYAEVRCDSGLAADPIMGPDSACLDTTLYQDGLHPTDHGHSILEPIFAAVINAM
jgi:hypothetical protein